MSKTGDLQGLARGIAFQLKENLGALKRETVADEINALDQAARAELRKYGLRFGAFNIFFPIMLKPAPADLAATLWLLKNGPARRWHHTAIAASRLDLGCDRPGNARRALSRPRIPRLRPARRSPRYSRTLGGSDPAAACLALVSGKAPMRRPKARRATAGFRATDDMMSILGLFGRGTRRSFEVAGLPSRQTADCIGAGNAIRTNRCVRDGCRSRTRRRTRHRRCRASNKRSFGSRPHAAEPVATSTESSQTAAETPVATEESAAPARSRKVRGNLAAASASAARRAPPR